MKTIIINFKAIMKAMKFRLIVIKKIMKELIKKIQ